MKRRNDGSCFVALPNYDGRIHITTMFGVLMATDRVAAMPMGYTASLLAKAFNYLWIQAIRSEHRWFAMLHADIGPDPYWLDNLLAELDKRPNGIVSACVPIKNNLGEYSCAMKRPGEVPYHRLTDRDIAKLPLTFNTGDVRKMCGLEGDLVVNTGCWACDLAQPWVKKVHFEINSAIEWNGKDVTMHDEPEDWYFSRQLHELGVPVYGTRAVSLKHWGQYAWPTADWGNLDVSQ